jgi:hypothetical protein
MLLITAQCNEADWPIASGGHRGHAVGDGLAHADEAAHYALARKP